MATAISGTKVAMGSSEYAGELKTKVFTSTITAATNDVDLSSYFTTIYYARAHLTSATAGDAQLLNGLATAYSGTTVTVFSQEEDGTPSTEWTGATISLLVLGVE